MPRRGVILALATLAGATRASEADDARVTIDNFSFTPASVTVSAGAKVTWVNRDDIPHTVTSASDPRAFKSAPLDTDDAFAMVFAVPGAYPYFCSLHPHMQGAVVVR